jgi:hypothetical protein
MRVSQEGMDPIMNAIQKLSYKLVNAERRRPEVVNKLFPRRPERPGRRSEAAVSAPERRPTRRGRPG